MGSEGGEDASQIADLRCSCAISGYVAGMRSRFKKSLLWLIATIALMMLILWLRVIGSAIIIDETGEVQGAFITDTHGKYQKLWQLTDGYFYTIPNLEGTFEIRCKGGKIFRHGYVTIHMDQKVRVTGDGQCSEFKYAD